MASAGAKALREVIGRNNLDTEMKDELSLCLLAVESAGHLLGTAAGKATVTKRLESGAVAPVDPIPSSPAGAAGASRAVRPLGVTVTGVPVVEEGEKA